MSATTRASWCIWISRSWGASGSWGTACTAITAGFLTRAVAWFLTQGIRVERILTANGSCYRSQVFAERALELGISQRFPQPYRPQTNGKAERFIRILLNEWAYAHAYHHSRWRTAALPRYLSFYNTARPHGGINGQTPIARLLTFL